MEDVMTALAEERQLLFIYPFNKTSEIHRAEFTTRGRNEIGP